MLNLKGKDITLEKEQQNFVNSLGKLKAEYWACSRKKFNKPVRKRLLNNQNGRCVYCGCYIANQDGAVEHIAGKAEYPEHMYSPKNLVFACHFCNSSSVKGSIDIVEKNDSIYEKCSFKMVHPYIDDVDSFLIRVHIPSLLNRAFLCEIWIGQNLH